MTDHHMNAKYEDEGFPIEAAMIGADADDRQAVVLSTVQKLTQAVDRVASATFRATAHGLYEARINGEPVDDSVMNPGWTSFEWRLRVQSFDVTKIVKLCTGEISIEVLLGNGWYRGKIGFNGQRCDYGSAIGFLGALEVSYQDGSIQQILTSTEWCARSSAITFNTLYDGETIDARLWDTPSSLDVHRIEFDRNTLVPQIGPAITRHEVVHPVRIWTSPAGKTLVDFGQNLVGWLRFSLTGPAGTEIVIRHAEVIEDGELGTRPLRRAKATDRFILSGGRDFFEPTLTFHGFRYAEVSGWPGELRLDDLEAVVVHSDISRTGWFECSDPMVNQLVSNSVWSQKGNFLDIPTDCPQRDEREGWTGDIAAFSPTAAFQFDVSSFLNKWLMDLAEETRHSDGVRVPIVVPDIIKMNPPEEFRTLLSDPTAIWGDASIWVPEALWNAYGDIDALQASYPSMVLHLESIERKLSSDGLWNTGFQFGDWLDPTAPPDDPAAAKADRYLVAQACLYRSASFAAKAAHLIDNERDAVRWRALADRTRAAFNKAYVRDGLLTSDATTSYALAIHFGLLDEKHISVAGERLAQLVREARYRVSTGFAGTPYITWALTDTGHVDDAYRLLLERSCPSWMYPITMGATTIWERWDSMLPNGKINPGEMTSFNHYALGSVCDWIYQVVGGIRPAAPGYASVRIEPVPGGGITWAKTAFDSVHGRIEVEWHIKEGDFSMLLNLPEDVDAKVVLPDARSYEVVGGSHRFGCALLR
ncbi:alpha-L-rhamnosidase [Coriobacterium glomerans PW2]|uniref:alpha-L-rhamnosidase n=1 Tax=Coriobacterium glomerans (strain ATCC 49209 / DSM 20642 / JCM 10262 / PW2) TaxID=700015 RepID=F2NBC7_CORGP|nr:family 78 glycoside hydrolase catalytic domain [Coriobacterium glomerans]AEB06663.1 alpha-L-rhamnosidase [Coriobacterium glomerans PW2]